MQKSTQSRLKDMGKLTEFGLHLLRIIGDYRYSDAIEKTDLLARIFDKKLLQLYNSLSTQSDAKDYYLRYWLPTCHNINEFRPIGIPISSSLQSSPLVA